MTPHSRRAFCAVVVALVPPGCAAHGPARTEPVTRRAPEGAHEAAGTGPGDTPLPPPQDAGRLLGRSSPVRLRIPAIGVDTPVMRLGLAPDGTVEVPPVAPHDQAGWYRHSPPPGLPGPSVILGHVTVGPYGDGVFRHLGRLRPGDRITTHAADGRTAGFTVGAVRTVAKARFPADAVYGDTEGPRLRLVTCGGPRTGDDYRDNVIVFAAPGPTAAP
ncbi:class F sortase [Streptomyces sp. CC77]|uniref:class F sortase n=1 Tax=Streptomyces sp. CC77 TaxID=1906739 RepID=UPI0008DDAD98|nr:class F sortase [Streptomyces sp. CC77]OII64687.1 class F sortase [Streptomyces sp. CC77]